MSWIQTQGTFGQVTKGCKVAPCKVYTGEQKELQQKQQMVNFLMFLCLVNFQCESCKMLSLPCPYGPLLQNLPPCTFSIYMITTTLHVPQGLALSLSTIKSIQNIYCVKNGDEPIK